MIKYLSSLFVNIIQDKSFNQVFIKKNYIIISLNIIHSIFINNYYCIFNIFFIDIIIQN
jgi:hypothetical protein